MAIVTMSTRVITMGWHRLRFVPLLAPNNELAFLCFLASIKSSSDVILSQYNPHFVSLRNDFYSLWGNPTTLYICYLHRIVACSSVSFLPCKYGQVEIGWRVSILEVYNAFISIMARGNGQHNIVCSITLRKGNICFFSAI